MDPVEPELRPNLLCNISVYVRCYGLGHYSGIEVWATCREYEIRLYCLTIHCVGAKFAFDRETINFFPHFRKRIQREKVAIINSGNIPARFRLDTSDLPKMFEVEPMQGECFPGIPFILNILCCLKFITDYLSAKVKCFEDGKTDYIELTFVIYPFPPSIEVQTLTFLCPVRQENAQSISVRNGMSVKFRKSLSNKNVFNIEGSKCLMLSSNEKKEYIINFYAYKEGTVHFDVIFTNEETSEYMFYQVKVIIHPSEEIWETIEMNALIDHSINKIISIYNPLQVNDTFKIILIEPTIDRYLKFEPSVINVQPEQKSDNEKVTIKPLDQNSPITEEIVCSFEPSIVGTNTAVVTAEYFRPYEIFKFKLVCECGPPQPQGPFDIYAFEPFILVFKNVFYAKQTFSCSCVYDDCCLVLPKPVFTLEARQAKEIKLSLKKDADLKEYTTMLRITDLPDKIYKWDYYFNVHR